MRNFLTFVASFLFSIVIAQPPGSIDSNFGNSGVVTTTLNLSSNANALAIQADGKIVIAGGSFKTYNDGQDFFCARYNFDGTLDTSFGNSGFVVTNFTSYNFEEAKSIAIQNDGKILVAGNIQTGIAIIRFNSDGSLDNSFGLSGIVTTTDYCKLNVIKIDSSNGEIIVGGDGFTLSGGVRGKIYKFTSNGILDTTFNSTGYYFFGDYQFVYEGTYLNTTIIDLEIASNGKISAIGNGWFFVGVGMVAKDFACRINNDGSIDNSFSVDGGGFYGNLNYLYGNDFSYSMVLNSDNSIVVGGLFRYDSKGQPFFKIFKIESDGTYTNAIDSNYTNFGVKSFNNAYMKIDNNGKYILASISDSPYKIALVSINPNFENDLSFGIDGKVLFNLDNPTLNSMAIQSDNKIVVVGRTANKIMLTRFNGSGVLNVNKFTNNEFNLYPNPAEKNILLKNNNQIPLNQKFRIYDINGRIISNGILNSYETEININDFEKGIYFIKIDNYNSGIKFIKK